MNNWDLLYILPFSQVRPIPRTVGENPGMQGIGENYPDSLEKESDFWAVEPDSKIVRGTNQVCFFTGTNKHRVGILALCQICVYANSASNPLIYNAVNEQFRQGFKNYFRSWIECVLKIKGSQRTDQVMLAGRQKTPKNIGTCGMCRSSESSINGTLCAKNDSQVNNNDRAEMLRCSSMETKVIAQGATQEYEELLTTV